MTNTGFDGILPGLPWLAAKHPGKPFTRPPDLLVLHSASMGDDPAGYLATMPDGRMASAHVSARSRDGDFVQQVALTRIAWHAGGSVCQGRPGVNARSIGVELPAHAGDRLEWAFLLLLGELLLAVPTLRWWTCHRWIKATKTDPVCWDDARVREVMRGLPLVECR